MSALLPAHSGFLRQNDPSVPPSDAQTPFRSLIPPPDHPRVQGIDKHTALSWCDSRRAIPQPAWLIERLEARNLLGTEYRGFSADGKPDGKVWDWSGEGGAKEQEVVKTAGEAVKALATLLGDEGVKGAWAGEVDGDEIRLWSNPELYMNPGGIRLDEASEEVREGIHAVLKGSLSKEGYSKVWGCCLTNGFLGHLVNGRGVMNEHSYNFRLFGDVPGYRDPKEGQERAWAYTFFGHHLCLCVVFVGNKQVIGPVFMGAEPDEIDQGPDAGLRLFQEQEMGGLRMMQCLPKEQRDKAQICVRMDGEGIKERLGEDRWNPFDERHLGGARQDNRVVPYEGCPVSEFSDLDKAKIVELFKCFNIYYPAPVLAHRIKQFRQCLDKTYFAWIGGYEDRDPYYYRIHSPVAFLEFDFHCGIFLTNTSPAHCHIHTVNRLPNRGDYGRALLDHVRASS